MSPPGPIADVGAEPTYDGQVTQFVAGEALGSRYFDRERRVIFVNGMGNSGANHRDSALALSVLQMCRVVGVYNLTGGFITDLVQCVTDKLQFDGLLADSADTSISQAESASGAGDRARAAMPVLRARRVVVCEEPYSWSDARAAITVCSCVAVGLFLLRFVIRYRGCGRQNRLK
jgi:hypothetical protein